MSKVRNRKKLNLKIETNFSLLLHKKRRRSPGTSRESENANSNFSAFYFPLQKPYAYQKSSRKTIPIKIAPPKLAYTVQLN